jgi:hypothetical protein
MFSRLISPAALVLLIMGCSHITHRARVSEGINMSAYAMPTYETYDTDEALEYEQGKPHKSIEYRRTEYQFCWGYAWKLKNGRKILLNLNSATVDRDPLGFMPSIGVYYQGTTDDLHYAAGFGAVVSPDPMIYWLWGRDLGRTDKSGSIAEINLGAGLGLWRSYLLHFKLLKRMGPFRAGFIGEYRRFWEPLDLYYGDGGYRNDVKSQLYLGIILIPDLQ